MLSLFGVHPTQIEEEFLSDDEREERAEVRTKIWMWGAICSAPVILAFASLSAIF